MKKIFIALVFIFVLLMPITLLQITEAHSPPWKIPSFAYIVASPNPVGVGQKVAVVMWVDDALPSSSVSNTVRRVDYKLTIEKPDGKIETMSWPTIFDTTSIQYAQFVPDQIGTYKLYFEYGGQTYIWTGAYQNDTYSPAKSKTLELNVEQEKLPDPISSYPMPSEYWTRPIEGQNTDWWILGSNWFRGTAPYIIGRVQPDGIAPNSAHVMWTKPIDDGGVVGGSNTARDGNTFYVGTAYNFRFRNPIIMYGRLFYELPYGNSANGGGYMAVDLRTGEELWWVNTTREGIGGMDSAFGYYYSLDNPNQHGIVPQGWIFTNNFAKAINPKTGQVATLNITSVPSGTEVVGPAGEILRYAVANIGTASNPNWRLTQWNSSKVFDVQTSGTINASLPSRYDWNISITLSNSLSWSIGRAIYGDIILLTQGSFGGIGTWDGANVTALSLKSNSIGQTLWSKNYPAAAGNITRSFSASRVDPENRVFILQDKNTFEWHGYSLDNGNYLWTTKVLSDVSDYEWFNPISGATNTVAYGNFYCSGYGGVVYCYDTKTGELEWTYGNGGTGNSSYSGFYTPWGNYPLFIHAIADDKIYVFTTEHSSDTPLYKNAQVRCLDAFTGEEKWTMMGYSAAHTQPPPVAVADGFLVYLNHYDMQIYSIGKGPSETTVTVSPKVTTYGSSILIEGTVMDLASGCKQKAVQARFPNGVPAVSDESMGDWMEYVYMQKPRPTDTTGVTVTLSVVDANGNYRDIGTTTSDADGFFSFNWTPDIEGKYTVYASFGGSESYWPSHAVTAFAVDASASTPTPTQQPQVSMVEQYFIPAVAGLAVLMIVCFAVAVLMLRKRP